MISNLNNLIFIFSIAIILSLIIAKLLIILAHKFNILDQPLLPRKIHTKPIPLLGGAGIYLSFLIIVLILWQTDQLLDPRMSLSLIVSFLVASFVLIINGILDDKFNLPPQLSIIGPILAILIVMIGGLKIGYITNPFGGVLYLETIFGSYKALAGLFSAVITFLWLLGITYTTKLLDGIDGLTSSIGLIASLIIFLVSLSWDVVGSTTSLLALSLAGAIGGFLILNWYPAKIFLGEGGSTFIGFSLGVLAIISGSKIATALLVMGFPLLDIFWVIARRIKNGQPIWAGDNQHLHFRLLSTGLSQRQIVIFLSTISLCFGLVSIFFTTKTKIGALLILLALMFVLSSWLDYKLKKTDEMVN